jgi:hypothetical protein
MCRHVLWSDRMHPYVLVNRGAKPHIKGPLLSTPHRIVLFNGLNGGFLITVYRI